MSTPTLVDAASPPSAPGLGPAPAPFDPPLWPISVALYTRMVESGVLREADRVYLWKGRLAPKMTIGRPHVIAAHLCLDTLQALAIPGCYVEMEGPLAFRIAPSAPEPDLKIVRGRLKDYARAYPTTADVLLIVEVADTSLAEDRRMASAYASEGIPTYWIVNIPELRIEVHAEPAGGAYGRVAAYGADDLVPVVVDGREVGRVRAGDLLP